MKILFIIQGEGRGHLTQALSLRQKLTDEGHQVVGVLVGKSPARRLQISLARRSKRLSIRLKVPTSCLLPKINRSTWSKA
jgi:UDP-N-acetylglucosamine:LPS N-acetylglucosamine transferase